MEFLCNVAKVFPERTIEGTRDGQRRTTTVVECLLDDGLNQFLASAFDVKVVDFPKEKAVIRCDLTFSVRETEKDGSKRYFQSIRINRYVVMSE